MKAFSSGGENGTGVSGAAIRLTGASRSSKASSAIVAAISAPNPPVRVSSWRTSTRSEEHTSELQSRQYLVCRLLLEKKKKPSIKSARSKIYTILKDIQGIGSLG